MLMLPEALTSRSTSMTLPDAGGSGGARAHTVNSSP